MSKVISIALWLVLFIVLAGVDAFLSPSSSSSSSGRRIHQQRLDTIRQFINIGEKERDALTRDSEPEEFFVTNTDKMSDQEKIPIAIAGIAFITLPFIAGLIALFSNQ